MIILLLTLFSCSIIPTHTECIVWSHLHIRAAQLADAVICRLPACILPLSSSDSSTAQLQSWIPLSLLKGTFKVVAEYHSLPKLSSLSCCFSTNPFFFTFIISGGLRILPYVYVFCHTLMRSACHHKCDLPASTVDYLTNNCSINLADYTPATHIICDLRAKATFTITWTKSSGLLSNKACVCVCGEGVLLRLSADVEFVFYLRAQAEGWRGALMDIMHWQKQRGLAEILVQLYTRSTEFLPDTILPEKPV